MTRERTFRSEAIILRRRDFSESDRLLTLFSRDYGKIEAIAKGARKPNSRKTGHVELFMRTNFLFAKGRDMNIITQAEMVEAYSGLREDLVRMTYASYFVELLDRFTADEDKHLGEYNLLLNGLHWLEQTADLLLAARYYELRLLDLAGYKPRLFDCVNCEAAIQEQDQFFSVELGGILCPNCQTADRRAKPISSVAVKVLRYLQTRDWQTVRVLQLKRPLHQELETLLHHILTYILERNLKSIDFLHHLRREADILSELPPTP